MNGGTRECRSIEFRPNEQNWVAVMRWSKPDVVAMFQRQETAYRTAILASHWLQDPKAYEPNAIDEARGMAMRVFGRWVSWADIAELLAVDPSRVAGDMVMNQLHASLLVPFEALIGYCEDYDKEVERGDLGARLRAADWFVYARSIRNAIAHNLHFHFDVRFARQLPTKWRDFEITADLHGQPIYPRHFGAKPGHELLVSMQEFAETLPAEPSELG
jgi:hypothetical protein